MRHLLLCVALLAACAPARPSQDQCDVEVYLQADVRDQRDAVDCGDFRSYDAATTDMALSAARDCVTGAANASTPFRVAWDADDPTAHVRIAMTGVVEGATYHLRQYVYAANRTKRGDVDRTIDVQDCGRVYARGGCTPTATDPCLLCADPHPRARICQPLPVLDARDRRG